MKNKLLGNYKKKFSQNFNKWTKNELNSKMNMKKNIKLI